MKHFWTLVQLILHWRWQGGHHDSCRVIAGSPILLPTVGENRVRLDTPRISDYFVLPAIIWIGGIMG